MKIIFYSDAEDHAFLLAGLRSAFPQGDFRQWFRGDNAPADYALVWNPPIEMLAHRSDLKAIFNLAAGVEGLLETLNGKLPSTPIIRIDDGGMAIQIAEYVTHAVLHYYRDFDFYCKEQTKRTWSPKIIAEKKNFVIGIMGMGILGNRIAQALQHFDFPIKAWSRHPKRITNIETYSGENALDDFLRGTKALICALPLTKETQGILNTKTFNQLKYGAYLINIARGGHLVEKDLLSALATGQIVGATLDVFDEEPLHSDHPFWLTPNIRVTPHRAAMGLHDKVVRQVVEKLRMFEAGEAVTGQVNRFLGY